MAQVSSANLVINQPIPIDAPDAELVIEIDQARPLGVGVHVFQLIVSDNADPPNQSAPVQVRVVVRDTQIPTAVAVALPPTVSFGERFTLNGRESSDPLPGQITRYIWTWLS